ncbi:MAG: hypothetical protein HY898_14460 [Deltaproteobacteria bacterium]|nr:hypothetical protein [Deltaproteobacteria bacterium]
MPRTIAIAALAAIAIGCGEAPRSQEPPRTPLASRSPPKRLAPEPEPFNPLAAVAPAKSGWYDASPLLFALRPALRPVARDLAGLDRLEQLPLYDLRLALDPLAGTFDLDQELYFTNRESKPLDEIVLRLYANLAGRTADGQPKAPRVSFARSGCPDSICQTRVESPSLLAIRPDSPLPPGGRLRMAVSLRGLLNRIDASKTDLISASIESLLSLGKEGSGDYGLLSVGEGIALFANAMAVPARRTEQGWDRSDGTAIGDIGSDDIAHVRARIELPWEVQAATVGSVASMGRATGADGKPVRVLQVAAPLVRDFTVVAGTGLVLDSRQSGDVIVRSMYRASDAQAGARVLDTAAHALESFERRFGMYPWAELDACEAALLGGAGGVEFSGLIALASMFYHQQEGSPLGQLLGQLKVPGLSAMDEMSASMLEFVTAHEVAHQWWHGLVGSDSRQTPFLDESLAQYSTILYLEDRHGVEQARRMADQNVRLSYQMMRLMGMADGAVDRPVSAFGSSIAYAGLVYGKGPYFYQHARKLLGDAAFFEALRRYVKAWQFRIAPPDGPVRELARGPKEKELLALSRRWLREAHGDQDLGRADLAKLLGDMFGGAGQGLDADVLKQLME